MLRGNTEGVGGARNVWFWFVSAGAVVYGVVQLASGATNHGEWELGLGLFGLIGCSLFAWDDLRTRRREEHRDRR